MKRIGYCAGAALIIGLSACGGQPLANETESSVNTGQANKVQQPANAKQPATKAAAPKCPNLATQLPVETPDLTRRVYACVERNALLYAKGPDSPEALSKAVIAKCKGTIVQYVDQEAKKAGVRPPYKEALESWHDHTLPIIAEARARGCYG